ncbi:MAG TPA: hypothetical protein VLA24_09375 [Pseudomonadales bacterium]|nr:hypothetical protein [Pseudomonadales bacterium]
MNYTFIDISRRSIDEQCQWQRVDENKVEHCQKYAETNEWVDGDTGYIYVFDVWGRDEIIDLMDDDKAPDVFYGWLYSIIADMHDDDTMLTLWDIVIGKWDAELGAKYLGRVNMDKALLLLDAVACTCDTTCRPDCLGECGCQKCHNQYMDSLSTA